MDVTRDTPLTLAYITWQFAPPETRIVVSVKATFSIVPDALCRLADEQQLCTGDTPHDEDETLSLRHPSDIVPFKPHGECLLAGTCYPPGGRATISAVGFRVGKAHKELAVFGDREWSGRFAAGVPVPKPFESMPLRWERAFGGPGHDRNPFGRGVADVVTPAGAVRPLPNIEDPKDMIDGRSSRPRPAGTFPLPAQWRAKESRLGTYDRAYMRDRWPYLPPDFDYEYFQSAPRELRIDGFWSGDEEIELKNVHPSHPVIHTRLPGMRPRAFLSHASAISRFEEVPLRLDTITVDADAMQVLCVWRGAQPVASEKLEEIEHLFVAHEGHGQERPITVYAARLAELLRARDEELVEAEGVEPGREDEAMVPAAEPVAEDADDPIAAATAALDEKLASLGVLVAPPATPEPPEPLTAARVAEMKAALESAGMTPPPELDELLTLLADPPAPSAESPAEVPPPPPDPRVLVARLRAGEPVAAEDWTGAELSELDLEGLDLSGAILVGARFVRTDLAGAKLIGAQLSGADFTEATLRDASLVGCDLDHATLVRADLTGAVLDDAWLEGAKLAGAHLPKASLRNAYAAESDFERCHMRGAILDGADLSSCRLIDADLRGASLVEATLEAVVATRATFEDADLTRLRASETASFEDASFKNAKAPGSRWMSANLNKANLSFVDLTRADFTEASLVSALLHGATARHGSFRGARLVGAHANKADFFEATFESADLAHADFRGSSFFGAQLYRARTEGTRFDLADLGRTGLGT